ncbi:MAG: hypothetical protein ACXABY_01670 [Candidatus Thorarchaeota archaeon]|jgi:hypothetical protein
MKETIIDVLVAAVLNEAKNIGSRKEDPTDKDIDLIVQAMRSSDPEGFASRRKGSISGGNRAYKILKRELKADVLRLVRKVAAGRQSEPQVEPLQDLLQRKIVKDKTQKKTVKGKTQKEPLATLSLKPEVSRSRVDKELKALLRRAYLKAYALGIKSSGVGGVLAGTHGHLDPSHEIPLTSADRRWLDSALKHEARFRKKFVADMFSGSGRMSYERRAEMYVNAVDNIYFTGRVRGTPSDHLFYWQLKNKTPCASCRFLAESGPYRKDNLPTLPRAGMTRCLTNCHCKVVARSVPKERMEKAWRVSYSKSYLQTRLREIKKA